MNERPKVSAIIPVYNAEVTLRQCLGSVLNQTYGNYEVVVVDNNSTDSTRGIIMEFQKKDARVRYIFERHRSVGLARNTGIKESSGEILIFTDSDCIVPENWIEGLTGPIRCEDENVAAGPAWDAVGNYWTKNIQKRNMGAFEAKQKEKYIDCLDGNNFAIKAALMKRLMFDPEIRMCDDFDFCIRLRRVAQIRYMESVKVGHYHPSSFKKIIKMSFIRGYWTARVYQKHESGGDRNVVIAAFIFIKNALKYFCWITLQLITKSIGEFYFILVTDLSWRIGAFRVKINKPLEECDKK